MLGLFTLILITIILFLAAEVGILKAAEGKLSALKGSVPVSDSRSPR